MSSGMELDRISRNNKDLRMGCASSQAAQATVTKPEEEPETVVSDEISDPPPKYPKSEAFVIPIDGDDNIENDDSLIKKHPPKRLLRLTEALMAAPTTIEDLEDKLAKAEVRRQQYLQQRVGSIANFTKEQKDDDDSEPNTADEKGTQDQEEKEVKT